MTAPSKYSDQLVDWLVGAGYTLFRMRKNLAIGMKRAVADLKKSGGRTEVKNRTERDLSSKVIFLGIGVVFVGDASIKAAIEVEIKRKSSEGLGQRRSG